MSDFEIRKATIEDAEGIARVKYNGWQDTYRGMIRDEVLDAMSLEKLKTDWGKILAREIEGQFHHVLLNPGNEIIGYVSGGKNRFPEFAVDGEIYAFYLLKEYHHKQLGKKLFVHAAEELKKTGRKSFCLFVLTENPAVKFYRKFKPDMEQDITGEESPNTGLAWSDIDKMLS